MHYLTETKNIVEAIFRCKVSGELEDLDALHSFCKWIPGSHQVRPSPEMREKKQQKVSVYV